MKFVCPHKREQLSYFHSARGGGRHFVRLVFRHDAKHGVAAEALEGVKLSAVGAVDAAAGVGGGLAYPPPHDHQGDDRL
mgnify:CR=1 FL=1